MVCLDPETTDGTADMARADNANLQLRRGGCLTGGGRPLERHLEKQRSGTSQERPPGAINTDTLEHQPTNCELQDESLSRLTSLVHLSSQKRYDNAKRTTGTRLDI